MKVLLARDMGQKVRRGLFNIDLFLPGKVINNSDDRRGLAQLGRFDFAHLYPGVFVDMHLHKNDEILTYMREGEMLHEDSHGEKRVISNKNIMMMNAGKGFYHQESISQKGTQVRLLQIFMRPENEDNEPMVQFHEFEDSHSINQWRLVAGFKENAPLKINTKASIYDIRIENSHIELPKEHGKTYLVFVFKGSLAVNKSFLLFEGDSYIYKEESLEVKALGVADLVLFELDENEKYIRNGMFSGT